MAAGAISSSKDMGGGKKSDQETEKENQDDTDNEAVEGIGRQMSEASVSAAEEEEDEEGSNKIQLGPQCTLKEQIEKDKVCFCSNSGCKKLYLFLLFNFFLAVEFLLLPLWWLTFVASG